MHRCLSHFVVGFCKAVCVFAFLALSVAAEPLTANGASGTLNLRLMVSGGEQRLVYRELIERFRSEHPGIQVTHHEHEQEAYKAKIEDWLRQPGGAPDVMFYFAGHLMADFYSKGLIRPITELWQAENWDLTFSPSIRDVVAYDGQTMGVPISYYHWGIYYRKSLFARLGLDIPETWDDFLAVGEALKEEGITPIALGSEARWPAAAWFDYLNLRTNGLKFHQDLLAGREDFDDDRVRRVFSTWQELVDRQFFIRGHSQKSWRSVLPYLYQNHAGMMLMGGFVVPQFPDQLIDDISLFRFPVIDPKVPVAEEAPTDLLFIPSRARNVPEAEIFLKFVARQDIQSWVNRRLGTIAPNRQSSKPTDRLVSEGQTLLEAASGYSQFFDRAMARPVSGPAMDAFVHFLNGELTVNATVATLTDIRKRPE